MKKWVFDSQALLSLLQLKPGYERIQEILRQAENRRAEAWISAITLGEIAHIVEHEHGRDRLEMFLMVLQMTSLKIADVNYKRAIQAAHVKTERDLPYTLAFPIALAQELKATLVTANPELSDITEVPVEIVGT